MEPLSWKRHTMNSGLKKSTLNTVNASKEMENHCYLSRLLFHWTCFSLPHSGLEAIKSNNMKYKKYNAAIINHTFALRLVQKIKIWDRKRTPICSLKSRHSYIYKPFSSEERIQSYKEMTWKCNIFIWPRTSVSLFLAHLLHNSLYRHWFAVNGH